VNWKRISTYAALLFVAQFLLGFFEGYYLPADWNTALASSLASLVVCSGIFAHLSAKQTSRPLVHAWAALMLQVVAAVVVSQVFRVILEPVEHPFAVLEWLILICALLIGTAAGTLFRRNAGAQDDF
jgi:hypothetical protein